MGNVEWTTISLDVWCAVWQCQSYDKKNTDCYDMFHVIDFKCIAKVSFIGNKFIIL